MRIITLAVLCALIAVVHLKFTPRLSNALESKRTRLPGSLFENNVWVMFNNKGNDQERLYPSAEAIARRQRNGYPAFDYAVNEKFVQQVQQLTKGNVRAKSAWFNAISLGGVTKAELEAIASLDFVSELDLVTKFTRVEPTITKKAQKRADLEYGSSSAQLSQINVLEAHNIGLTGANITIGVLDSGFRLTHNAYKKLKVKATFDFVNNDTNVDNEAGQDVAAQYEHGTMTLSLIGGQEDGKFFGAAFDATFLLAKTEDWSGERIIEEDYFARGMEWVERNGADIATASLGYSDWYVRGDLNGKRGIATRAYNEAIKRGVICVSSQGNGGTATMGAPADSFYGISVGSVTITGEPSDFSSRGPTGDGRIKPEVVAFGEDALVVDPASTTGYVNRQGTSYSCPLMAGAIALILQKNRSWTPMQMREALMNTASNRNAPNNVIGWGIPDVIAAINYSPANYPVDNCVQGVRVNGTCSCYDGYGGALCDARISNCGIWNCRYGYCNANATCTCFQGYAGSNCLTSVRSTSSSLQISLALVALLVLLQLL